MYHYTSEDGFRDILTSSSLWLTSAHYMDDPSDCKWIYKLLQERIESVSCSSEKEALKAFIFHCKINYPIPYIASFSLVKDDISQWDRYANNGKGVLIEFKKEYFGEEKLPSQNVLRTHNLTHHRVEYRKNVHDKFVNDIVEKVLDAYKKSNEGEQELEKVKAYCSLMVNQHSMIFKCPAYNSEKEIRVIHTPFRFSGEIVSYEEGGCVGDLRVRPSSHSEETPYFVLQFPKRAINSVTVGPKNPNLEDVNNFAIKCGYDIPVRQSMVPFR